MWVGGGRGWVVLVGGGGRGGGVWGSKYGGGKKELSRVFERVRFRFLTWEKKTPPKQIDSSLLYCPGASRF